MLDFDFIQTLETAAVALNAHGQEWVVFGGAAMVLHGLESGAARDIDILVSNEIAVGLMAEFSLKNWADRGSERFRSEYFLQPDWGPIDVEILGGFDVRSKNRWHRVVVEERKAIRVGRQTVFVPRTMELADIFDRCGRPKDLARSQLIRAV